ncbi:MAG TPA: hypothetical protein PLK08_08125, partial [Phycisphaerae bacterium]|nr:hypothetical protein [Phycisphaerae bacterium]
MTSTAIHEISSKPPKLFSSYLAKTCDWLALVVAFAACILFAVRPVGNADIGYHLSFGEHLWKTGSFVRESNFVYVKTDDKTDIGPGEWWDDNGVMRIVPVSWGTQAVMWWFYDNWGFDGIFVLTLILVGSILGLTGWLCVRLGLPASLGGVVILLCSFAGYERFYIRPELFSYIFMLCNLHVMLGFYMGRLDVLSWKKIFLLAVIQIFMVNVHSYFLLGWLFVFLPLCETAILWLWQKYRKGDAAEYLPVLRRLAIAFFVVIAASFVSPSPWRLFMFPFEMLLYLRQAAQDTQIPINSITELFSPFDNDNWQQTSIFHTYVISLGLVGAGCICGLYRRKWLMVGLMLLMVAQSLTMRRNILPSCVVMLPMATECIWSIISPWKNNVRKV